MIAWKKALPIVAAILISSLVACNKQETATTGEKTAAPAGKMPPAGHPTTSEGMAAAGMHAQEGKVTGKVLEVLDARAFTYIRLQTSEGELWAAINKAPVSLGSTITIETKMAADRFESQQLGRTFEKIVFGHLEGSAPTMPPHGMTSPDQAPETTPPVSNVVKAEGPEGRRVAEVWAERKALAGKPVQVRGKVVKFLENIMGTNWVHLQDGSGTAAKGDNDLTVTTKERASVGDVVTASGRVRIDKDFGSGYNYAVLVEEAKLQK